MPANTYKYVTPSEYLANERVAESKHEYRAGRVEDFAGAGQRHNKIQTNLIVLLVNALRGRGCDVYGSDMRVKVDELGPYFYPDISVACRGQRFEDAEQDSLLNPTVIIEVLSDRTEAYDRGVKFEQYRRLASLREYVLVAQDRMSVEKYDRGPNDEWNRSEVGGSDAEIRFEALDVALRLADIYEQVPF